MNITIEDLIKHLEYEQSVPEGADVEYVLELLSYETFDLYHMVNGKNKARDFKLSENDIVSIIPVLIGG